MTVLTEAPRPGEAIVSEDTNYRSREQIVVAESQTLAANQVIGQVVTAATVGAAAAVAGNTGNGTVALGTPSFQGSVQAGTYRVVFVAATRFQVFSPSGALIDRGVTGTIFSNQIRFTITAGGTAFAAGDAFTFAVSALTVRWGAYDPAATDGRQVPAGMIFDKVTTGSGATARAVALVRDCQLNAQKLQWLTGLNANQQAAAIALLNASAAGITVRS
jgi:hypothetical protein